MNYLKNFENNEFGQVRAFEFEGKTYFVASDIAKALGYKDVTNAVKQHCRWVVKHHIPHPQNTNKKLEVNIIPEGDMYRLITNSELPSAERFESWVFDEVLPSLRKTGSYQKPLTQYEIMQKSLDMLTEQDGRLTKLENNMTIDYGQQLQIEKLVNKQVTDALGGKESAAYKEIGKKVFSECNRDVKNYFNVNSRNNIAVIDFEKARKFIKGWKPSYTTQLLINDCNAQMCMNQEDKQ